MWWSCILEYLVASRYCTLTIPSKSQSGMEQPPACLPDSSAVLPRHIFNLCFLNTYWEHTPVSGCAPPGSLWVYSGLQSSFRETYHITQATEGPDNRPLSSCHLLGTVCLSIHLDLEIRLGHLSPGMYISPCNISPEFF